MGRAETKGGKLVKLWSATSLRGLGKQKSVSVYISDHKLQ